MLRCYTSEGYRAYMKQFEDSNPCVHDPENPSRDCDSCHIKCRRADIAENHQYKAEYNPYNIPPPHTNRSQPYNSVDFDYHWHLDHIFESYTS